MSVLSTPAFATGTGNTLMETEAVSAHPKAFFTCTEYFAESTGDALGLEITEEDKPCVGNH